MPLNKTQLQSDVLAAFQAAAAEKDPASAQKTLAEQLANAVNSFVSSAAVRGISVDITKGNPAVQTADGTLH